LKKRFLLVAFSLSTILFFSGSVFAKVESDPIWRSMTANQSRKAQSKIPKHFNIFGDVFVKVNRSVVNISTMQVLKGVPAEGEKTRKNLGSGAIISESGYIVTNYHVIENEKTIAVKLADGSVFRGNLIGRDNVTDLALLKIDAKKPLASIYFSRSPQARVGDWVLAIGNPFGFHNTATQGIVSAVGRVISSDARRKRFDDFIQIDASINPGNSGGPLVNLAGEMIGINTAMTSTGSGIAFAIPVLTVKRVVDDLYRFGRVKRGWLGLVVDEQLPGTSGLRVLKLVEGSPAANAGIKMGDYVIAYNNIEIESLFQFSKLIAASRPQQSVSLKIMRDGKLQGHRVLLEDFSKRSFNGPAPIQ
jgi:serine protease Do